MSEHPKVTPHTVEFDVCLEDGTHVGGIVTWALPNHGDHVRVYPVDDPGHESVAYVVVRSQFEPDNITVVVKALPQGEGGYASW